MIPDLLIAFGPRSLLAFAGIVILIAGVWYVDRTWDEKGSRAYTRAKESGKEGGEVVISTEDLDAAFPFPIVFLIGWVLFALSYIFPTDGSMTIDLSPVHLLGFVLSLALGAIASVPMGNAVRNRNASKKKKLSMTFVLCWLGLTIVSGFSADAGAASFVLCGAGMVCIVASMKILWKHRKMGDTWEQEGKPNPNPVVYNLGGPLFVFGWFLFWVGMSATSSHALTNGLPIYFNLRTALAFFAGCGMVPIVMMMDYAHDEGGKYVGFGTDGTYFGRFFESPIPFIVMWTLFGFSSFLQPDNTILTSDARRWILLANCIAQGITAGLFIQTALYKGQMKTKNRWSMLFVLLFAALAINLGIHGSTPLYLGVLGAFLVIAGQKTVFRDRKRGDHFMINHTDNPNPIVYSVGEPLFMAGWIALSLSVSLPMP